MQGKDLFDIIVLAAMIILAIVLYIAIGIYVAWFTL